jgi:hypothetical protein
LDTPKQHCRLLNVSVKLGELQSDPIITYQSRFYSETEFELYVLAYHIIARTRATLNQHDLMGGDYKSFQVNNAEECLAECEASSQCTGFTFRKRANSNEQRDSCYLKDR